MNTEPPTPVRPAAGVRESRAERVPTIPLCDLCGGPMIDRHCKLSCSVCGYQRDCSDP